MIQDSSLNFKRISRENLQEALRGINSDIRHIILCRKNPIVPSIGSTISDESIHQRKKKKNESTVCVHCTLVRFISSESPASTECVQAQWSMTWVGTCFHQIVLVICDFNSNDSTKIALVDFSTGIMQIIEISLGQGWISGFRVPSLSSIVYLVCLIRSILFIDRSGISLQFFRCLRWRGFREALIRIV